jgi:ribosome biogenesis GTPase
MAPKYRGDEEDWLDNEDLAGVRGTDKAGNKAKRGHQARSTDLPWEDANATVAEVFQDLCRVELDLDQRDLLCRYRRAEVVSKAKADVRERSPVAVGDRVWVAFTEGQQSGVVEGICKRKNRISRPAPGRDGTQVQHVLAANIDVLVVVASAEQPHFSPGLVDRFLVAAQAQDIPAVLCVTKIDLLKTDTSWKLYRDLGYSVFEVSVIETPGFGPGLIALMKFLTGKTAVFCGQSGVGKTSLLRKLLGVEFGQVGSVNEYTGKGKHTTTGAVLLGGPSHSHWIDTPGVKEFGLVNVTRKTLKDYFPEFKKAQCREARCSHMDEKECGVRELPRYLSYRKILETLSTRA